MRRHLRRRAPAVLALSVAALSVMALGGGTGVAAASVTGVGMMPSPSAGYAPTAAALQAADRETHRLPRVIVPDLFAVSPRGVTTAELTRLARLHDVRGVLAVDGGAVRIDGHLVVTIGVNAGQFRSWTPAATAAQQAVWTALGKGELVTTATAASTLRLRGGRSYRVSGAGSPVIKFGGTATLGIPHVDAVVGSTASRALGLVPRIGVLVSAPRASLASLGARIRALLGPQARVISLRSARHVAVSTGQLPVDGVQPAGQPTSWLALFRDSAARYCPGLSWTVLAAIGQIESGDGQNNGPSSAGALGPMQFLPSTWAKWGVVAFGQPSPPDIGNPYDAVPAAALYLCASGGASTATLPMAIFSYNHAAWYVAEVLALAHEYAQQYG